MEQCLVFLLSHEIKHFKDYNSKKYKQKLLNQDPICETRADSFAIEKMNEFDEIKKLLHS